MRVPGSMVWTVFLRKPSGQNQEIERDVCRHAHAERSISRVPSVRSCAAGRSRSPSEPQSSPTNLRTAASGTAPTNWLTGCPSLNATTVGSAVTCGEKREHRSRRGQSSLLYLDAGRHTHAGEGRYRVRAKEGRVKITGGL